MTQPHTPQSESATLEGSVVQILTFQVDGEEYGMDIMAIKEIKGWIGTTRLPNSPDFVRGVMNLRGTVLPIFDLRQRFGKGATEATAKHVNIIVTVDGFTLGILVDAVSDILLLGHDEIRHAPASSDCDIDSDFVAGLISHQGRMIVVLNLSELFDADVIRNATAQHQQQQNAYV